MNVLVEISIEEEIDNELVNEEEISSFVEKVLKDEYESEKDVYVSLFFTNNEKIREINKEYRDKDKETDVISFAYLETGEEGPYEVLGDIIISVEKAEEQANEYGHSLKREFYYLLVHGILHLLGYDHIEDEDKKEMREKEEEILKKYINI